MTTTPPPEGTTEPPVECVAVDRDERCLCPGGPASHRPSSPAPAAEDDAVDRAREVSQALALDPGCHEDMGDGPCGIEPVAARIDPGAGMAYPVCIAHVRDDMVPLAALAGSGEQPGPLKAGVMALTGLSSDEVDALGGVREDDAVLAPVVPDSTDVRDGLPFYIEDGAARVLVFKSGGRRPATASEVAMWDLLAVVGQGVTAEQRDEAIRAAAREVAKQARSWPGDGLLHDVPPVEAADAAVRAALESLGIAVVRSGEQGGEG